MLPLILFAARARGKDGRTVLNSTDGNKLFLSRVASREQAKFCSRCLGRTMSSRKRL